MASWLVTGGAGFIGSHFVRNALQAGEAVTNLDALTYAGNPANLQDVQGLAGYRFVKGDVADEQAVAHAAKSVEVILNFAAETHVDRSIVGPDAFLRTNVLGTRVLLDAARRRDADYVQVSTDEVYGSTEMGSFRESDALSPSSPYSASKAAADLLAQAYGRTYGLRVWITRSTNNFGPGQHPEKLIPRLVTNALRGLPLPVYGDGKNVRDWIYVEDNCEAIALALRKGAPGTYNIGAGNELPNIEIAERVVRILGKPASPITHVADRPGHDRRYSVDAKRIRALGWKPRAEFGERLEETVEWYRAHEGWWKPLVGASEQKV